jgi:hypothetical protein
MYRNVRPPFGGSVHFFMSSIAEPSEMVTLSRWVGNQYRNFFADLSTTRIPLITEESYRSSLIKMHEMGAAHSATSSGKCEMAQG